MNKRILVIDDNATVREILKSTLLEGNYNVDTAEDGMKGLDMMFENIYDLVICDIDMPNLSGYSVVRLIKTNMELKDTPVLMLTGREEKKDKFWGHKVGANAYLVKSPNVIDKEILFNTIESLFKESSGVPKRQAEKKLGNLSYEVPKEIEKQIRDISIFNEIYTVSSVQFDFDAINEKILNVISQVFENDILAFFICGIDEKEAIITFYINNPVSKDFLQAIKRMALTEFNRLSNNHILSENLTVKIYDKKNNLQRGKIKDITSTMVKMLPLETKGKIIGILSIGNEIARDISSDDLDLLKRILNQVSLIFENIRLYEKVKKLSVVDGLTNLYNHRYFYENLKKEYLRAERYNTPLSVSMLDIDFFKNCNDKYGHQFGDEVLKEIARILLKTVRETDIVSRYGGEEFSIILPETEKENAKFVSERIRKSIEAHKFMAESNEVNITISVGVSGLLEDAVKDYKDLVTNADKALYYAKQTGKNKVCGFNEK